MSCRDVRDRIQAYADGELGTEGVLESESHLERCPDCRAAFERHRALRRMVATLYPQREPPAALEQGIRGSLRGGPAASWRRASAAAAVVLAVGLAAWLASRRPDTTPPVVHAALGLHRAAAGGALALGLESRDLGEVNRWLRRELPFVTELPEATRGIGVLGAAAVELAGTRAGHVLYQTDARPISLFVLPRREWPPMGRAVRSDGIDFRWIEAGRERVVAWSHDPVSYLLVSDATRAPSEACGVCHANGATRGAGLPPADALHEGRGS